MPATDIEGVGRVAHLADPYGARFAVLRPAPRQG
ncbi:VOC family protein OS=Streptomyces tendae OX=1932 GN=GUR47_02410 PE=4 SV=1 [Streptomyces tendae]